MIDYASQAASYIGTIGLFLGTQTAKWTVKEFTDAAKFARAHKIDTLYVKVADGANVWYGGLANFKNIHDAIIAEGVGCMPYIYSYGDKFNALSSELDIMEGLMRAYGGVIADMEIEYNNQTAWASRINLRLRPVPGYFFVSTWGDPFQQNWIPVINVLAPCVNVFMPQYYTDWLDSQLSQYGDFLQFPTFYLGTDIGANDVLAHVQAAYARGIKSFSLWEYTQAVQNPSLLDSIVGVYKPSKVVAPPPPPTPGGNKYMDQAMNDCWFSNGRNFSYTSGIAQAWQEEYRNNKFYGAALCPEYASVDWHGNKITVQEFPGGRCEWSLGRAVWINRP